jgi:MurNAc alpha-1-phosphate uridylyltransferase
MSPKFAIVLAAGRGLRMRPLTERTPKALLPLGGRALLDHALDRLAAAGVETVVVNAHWQAERLAEHLAARPGPPRVILRPEDALLDTGGAVLAALTAGDLPGRPFYVVNGDTFWLDGPRSALARMADGFDADRLDGILLVHRTFQVHADVGRGDFHLDKWGAVRRRAEREVVPYVYAGVQLVSPSLFEGAPDGAFSMNLLWDRAIERERLNGLVHDGLWFHLSTPADLTEAESNLQARALGEAR